MTEHDATPANGDRSAGDELGLSRRDYVKGLGAAGLVAGLGLSADEVQGAIDDANAVTVGSGSYATAQPGGVNDPPGGNMLFATDDVDAPYPTNGWWTRELIGAANNPDIEPYADGFGMTNAVPQMVVSKENGDGFRTFYATDWGSNPAETGNVSVDYDGSPGLDVGHAGTNEFDGSHLAGYGDWHAEIQYGSGSTTLTATFTKGAAFTFCEYAGGEAAFSLVDADDNPLGPDGGNAAVFYDGGNVLGLTVTASGETKHYGIFAPANVTFDGVDNSGTLDATTITTSGLQDNGGYLSVAPLPDDVTSTIEEFEKYAYNVVTDTTVDWEYVQTDENGNHVSEVVTTFEYSIDAKSESTASGALSWLFPHQYKYSEAGLKEGQTLFSAKGTLKLWSGTSFQTTKTYRGILPELPGDQLDASATDSLQSYVDQLITDSDATASADGSGPYTEWQPPAATYWVGKTLFRNTVAAPVAQQHASSGASASVFLDAVQDRLEHWFDAMATAFTHAGDTYDTTTDAGDARELFYYDPTLGTMLGYPSGEFFLSRQMNDHHFHYGYFVYAASEVARQNDGWADEYGDMVDLLIRDYANWQRPTNGGDGSPTATVDGQTPKNAPKDAFPFLRNFDAYAGHSWAGGLGSWNGNNQEASSEAVNAYAAMIRWGEITDNPDIRDAGIFLYTQEVHAVWEYWFDVDDATQPDNWGANVDDPGLAGSPESTFEYATKVRGIGFDRDLWWSPVDPIEHYGINWIPTGGHSFYLGRNRAYANANWQAMLDARANDPDISAAPDGDFLGGWKAAAWSYRALSNPGDAASIADGAMSASDGPILKDGGNSGPAGYQFAHALDAMGTPDDVTADTPFYQVFADGSKRTYVAHNAGSSSTTVSFSDGYSMTVDPGQTLANSSSAHYDPDGTAPEQPANLAVDGTSYNSIDLSWDAVTDEESGLFYYAVYLDDGSSDGSQKVAEAAEPETTLTDLTVDTQYTIEVTAVDLAENESSAASTTGTTDTADTAIPDAPDVPFAIEWDADSVELGWSAVTDLDFGIDHYNLYVDGTKHTEASEPPYTLTGLSGSEVTLTVSAVNGGAAENESDQSDPITVTLEDPSATNEPYFDTAQPLPGRLQVEYFDTGGSNVAYRDTTAGKEASASLRPNASVAIGTDAPTGYNIAYTATYEWLEYTVSVDAAGTYDVYGSFANGGGTPSGPIRLEVDGSTIGGPYEIPTSDSWTSFSTTQFGTVTFDSAGEYVVRLYCEGGGFNLDYLEIREQGGSGDDAAPTAPSNPTATPGEYSVDLSWDAASDTGSSVFYYQLYRDGSPVATAAGTSATMEGLSGGTEYEFGVAAVDAFGNESSTTTVSATTKLPEDDGTPPSAPSNVRALGRTMGSFDLAWDAASDNVGVDHYVVSVDGTDVLETDQLWATVDDRSAATTYEVSVRAVDAAGNEGSAATVTVTTADETGQAPFDEPIELPGTIHAEEFDTGGQGISYADTTAGNQVNVLYDAGIERRDETDVDVGATSDSNYNVGYITDGEWMEYTIEVPATGLYDVAYRVCAGGSGGDFHLEVDGVNVTGTVSASGTGNWSTYETQGPVEEVPLTKGTHVLRFVSQGGFNLDHFEVSHSRGQAIDRSDWAVTPTAAYHDADGGRAIDGDPGSDWASNIQFQTTAIEYTVDMGKSHDVGLITIDHIGEPQAPSTMDVQLSSDGSNWTTAATVDGAASMIVDLGSVTGRYFRLVERDDSSTNWWKITDLNAFESVSDLRNDETAPGAPSDLTVDSQTGYQATLSWGAPGDADVQHYDVFVDGALARRVTATSAVVSGLSPGGTHDVTVESVDVAGNASPAATTTVDTTVALAAYTETPTELSPSTLELRFDPEGRVTDASVTVKRNGGNETTLELIDDGGSWYVVLGSLSAGDTVDYAFQYERAGESLETDQLTHEFAGDSQAGGPSNLGVDATSATAVTLSWDASSVDVDQYAVLEGSTAIGTVSGGTTEFQATGLSSQTRYRFGVVGIVSDGNDTPLSNTVTVETPSFSAAQARQVAGAWLDGDAPEGIGLSAGEVDYGRIRDAATNATEGDQ
ncbi:hypothetical protein GCM10028857_25960 [Salinarchaeum chitinilyticum]